MRPLDDEHRARIEASLPAGVTMTLEAWVDLEEIVRGYLIFRDRRATYPIEAERARWQRIGKAAELLADELRQLCREMPWTDRDPLWPERALQALVPVRHKVETRNAFHDSWRAFGGRRNPDAEFLFWGVLRVWTDHLGGELRYSSSDSGGPTVSFFLAAVEPVMGDRAPRPASVGNIIRREREGRERVEVAKQRLQR